MLDASLAARPAIRRNRSSNYSSLKPSDPKPDILTPKSLKLNSRRLKIPTEDFFATDCRSEKIFKRTLLIPIKSDRFISRPLAASTAQAPRVRKVSP